MDGPSTFDDAWGMLPSGAYLLTAAFDSIRGGTLVQWVGRCASEPPLISVAAPKAHCIEAMIRDSRAFGVCVIEPEDRFITQRFSVRYPPDEVPDLFDSLPTITLETGSPIIKRARAAFDCELVRHLDLDADHELYVGHVKAARVFKPGRTAPGL